MKTLTCLLFLMFLAGSAAAVGKVASTDLLVLNENTFVQLSQSPTGGKNFLLFKVEGNSLNLVDALQVEEKIVNYKPLLEVEHLKVERK